MVETYTLVDVESVLDDALRLLQALPDDTFYKAGLYVRQNAKIEWNNRMTKVAGQATWIFMRGTFLPISMKIGLSNKLLSRVDHNDQINTITHEFAHLIHATLCHGKSDHGPEWKRIHKLMNGTGEQYHTISREGLYRNTKRFKYVNSTGDRVILTSHSVNKYQKYLERNGYTLVEIIVKNGPVVVNTIPVK